MQVFDLSLLKVLVLRPERSGRILCEAIRQAQGEAIHFPTIEIVPLQIQLEEYEGLIFISPEAVHQSISAIRTRWPIFPPSIFVAAVGGGTAKTLQAVGLPVHFCPQEAWSSEGLIQLLKKPLIAGKKIALIKGEGGRTSLVEFLQRHAAQVFIVNAYRRKLPDKNFLLPLDMDVMIATSNEILHHFLQLTPHIQQEKLLTIPVLVISTRMALFAEKLGFTTIFLAKNASLNAIMTELASKKDYLCRQKIQQ